MKFELDENVRLIGDKTDKTWRVLDAKYVFGAWFYLLEGKVAWTNERDIEKA